jgi:hypothetical protein
VEHLRNRVLLRCPAKKTISAVKDRIRLVCIREWKQIYWLVDTVS